MKKPFKALKLAAIPALTLAASIMAVTSVNAAIVPAGTQLAKVQELVRGNGAEPASLDPQKIEGVPGSNVAKDLFEGLVSQDAEGNTIPGQAESWTVSDDNKVFTFKIRDTARWSNGDPVTAGDFVFAFQRAVDPATASRYAWYMEIPTIVNA
ncbi:ABC transporter substrate-binding protein [Endozoicomonas sp. 4G]|uniref:ABC transporter substrate-binding protein n=1 Tax=Endozoicomonas sp. 4G TaxID=2872754 RepID=UPI0023EED7C4|nr:ABC transporter substrate-binding protein [Endozoicomonas sp. 4G]